MNKVNIYWGIFIVFTFLSACGVQKEVQIEVLKPASIDLPDSLRRLVLIDNTKGQPANQGNYYIRKKLNKKSNKTTQLRLVRPDTLVLDSLGASCVFNAANMLSESEYLDTVIVWPFNTSELNKEWNKQMVSPEMIKQVVQNTNADIVATLDVFAYETVIEYTTWNAELFQMGANAQFYALWRFYDAKTSALLDRLMVQDTFFFDIGYYDIASKQYIETLVSETAWETGNYSAKQMYPWWKKVSRVYFKNGTPGIRLGSRYYKHGVLDEAAREWFFVYRNYSGKSRARAAFNLAFYSELKGNLADAITYLREAAKVYEESKMLLETNIEYQLIEDYAKVITLRMKELEHFKQ